MNAHRRGGKLGRRLAGLRQVTHIVAVTEPWGALTSSEAAGILAIMRIPAGPTRLMLALLFLLLAHPAAAARAAGLRCEARETDGPSVGARTDTPEAGYYYTVQQDDTLWDIAAMHDLTLEDLLAVNPLIVPDLLQPGQTVFVPGQAVTITQTLPPAVPVATVAPAPQPTPPVSSQTSASAVQMAPGAAADLLGLINAQRAANGSPGLAWSAVLANAAQQHAADCAQRDWGSHYGSDGSTLRMRLARAGYAATVAGENWAYTLDAQETFTMWWNDGPHRRNILGPEFGEIGIGVAGGGWGYYFVADFASR